MEKIKSRLKEPSTHAGLAGIVAGLGMILRSPETTEVAQTIPDVASRIVAHDYVGALMMLFGSLAVILREKK